jgi:aldose 1-epimerase
MLTLASGTSSVVVAPEYGAALVGWMRGPTPMLRRALPQATIGGDPHTMGCFPLLPYGNRLGHGRFRWCGTEYTLKSNFGDSPHNIHGIGWQRPWAVEATTATSIHLTLDHSPDPGWPFAFSACLRYTLSDTALTIDIRITNRHAATAPAGIGVHPFFPKSHDPSLCFNATGAWRNGADALPVAHAPPPAAWQHATPRPERDSRLDNCFTGWDGTADIQGGPASVRIEASPVFRQLQVFTPSWADFFCLEPISHVPDAINRPDLPSEQAMHVLQPNATLAGSVRFIPIG